MNILDGLIKRVGMERADNVEIVIRALKEIGINPENCFFDGKDNLIIPVSEIQK